VKIGSTVIERSPYDSKGLRYGIVIALGAIGEGWLERPMAHVVFIDGASFWKSVDQLEVISER